MFNAYNQPRLPRRCYNDHQARWQYWYWFRQPVPRLRQPREKVVYSGNSKGAIAVCVIFLGIFCVISGLFMSGFGFSYTYSSPLQIIGPVFLGIGLLMIVIGIVLCVLVSRELAAESEEASPAMEVESPGEEKPLSKPTAPKLPRLVMNNNGTSPVASPTKHSSVSTSPPSTPCSPGNGISPGHPAVVVTPPPDGWSSPKSPRLPFKPIGPAFAIADKQARAASIERLNEIGLARKKVTQPASLRHSSVEVDIMARERKRAATFSLGYEKT